MRSIITAMLLATTVAAPALAANGNQHREQQQNRVERQQNRFEARDDRREIRQDRNEIQRDRAQGRQNEAQRDRAELQRDRAEFRQDQNDRRDDRAEFQRDRAANQAGRGNTPAERARDRAYDRRDDRRDVRDVRGDVRDGVRDYREDRGRYGYTGPRAGYGYAGHPTFRNGGRPGVYNGRPYRGWSGGWRGNSRYDWRGWRARNPYLFRGPRWYAPRGRGYGYRRYDIGFRLAPVFFGSSYWIGDPWNYRLPPAYGPYRWVRYYNDVALVDIRTGEIVDIIYSFFY